MRAQREAVKFGRQTVRLIPKIVVTDTHITTVLDTTHIIITVALTI